MDQTKDPLLAIIKQKGPLSGQTSTRGAGSFDNQALLRALMLNKPQIMGAGLPATPPNAQELLQKMQGLHNKGHLLDDKVNILRSPMEVNPANQGTNIQSILDALALPKNKSDAQKFMEAFIQQQKDK